MTLLLIFDRFQFWLCSDPTGSRDLSSHAPYYTLSEINNTLGGISIATQDFKRQLTAILSADVEGYSRLMREDEEARAEAAEVLRVNPKLLSRDLQKEPGLGLLEHYAKQGLNELKSLRGRH